MRITYVHQYYKTPDEGGALRSWRISQAMIQAGHEVSLVAAHTGPVKTLRQKQLTIHYLPVPYSSSFSALRRIRAFISFYFQARRFISRSPKPDLLFLSSTPLTVGFIGPWAKRKYGLPYVFEVRDLWPDAPIQMGVIRNQILIRWLKKKERELYNHAAHIVALSPGMKQGILRTCPTAPVSMIPNMADMALFGNLPAKALAEKKLGLPAMFRIAYTGAMGPSNGLHKCMALANACFDLPIEFVFAGEGPQKKILQDESRSNVRVLPPVDAKGIGMLLAASDMVLVSFSDIPVLQTNSPNKFFDGLAAGKPILAAMDGWIGDLVSQNQCGLHLSSQNSEQIKLALIRLMNAPQDLEAMGRKAARLALQFDSRSLCHQLIRILPEVDISDPTRP